MSTLSVQFQVQHVDKRARHPLMVGHHGEAVSSVKSQAGVVSSSPTSFTFTKVLHLHVTDPVDLVIVDGVVTMPTRSADGYICLPGPMTVSIARPTAATAEVIRYDAAYA